MVKKIILILLFVSVSFFGFADDAPPKCKEAIEALTSALAETTDLLAEVTNALDETTKKLEKATEQAVLDQAEIINLRGLLEDCLAIETVEEKFSFGIGATYPPGGIVYLSFNPFEIPLGLFGTIGINKTGFLVGFGLDFDF